MRVANALIVVVILGGAPAFAEDASPPAACTKSTRECAEDLMKKRLEALMREYEKGWYQIESNVEGDFLRSGPFNDETSCAQYLPAGDPAFGFRFYCAYYAETPKLPASFPLGQTLNRR
jgi:hypothetical protein